MSNWVKGICAAAISGASGGIVNAFSAIGIAPESFNLHAGLGLHNTLKMLGVGSVLSAILGVAWYFKQSPLPPANSSGK